MAAIKPGALPGSYVFVTTPGAKTGTVEMPIEAAAPSVSNAATIRQGGFSVNRSKPRVLTSESPFYERSVKFSGYFKEGITESSVEVWRIRYLILQFYLGDETLDIEDPETQETKNDGIIHGKFLRRAKVDGLTRESFGKLLRIGLVFNVFSRGIHLYACDEATRSFFEDLGHPQPANENPQLDAYTTNKIKWDKPPGAWHGTKSSTITRYLEASLGSQRDFKKDLKERFLKFDGVQLRFLLLWEYPEGTKIERTKFWLTYYLATEEAEIQEEKGQKSYISWSTFLRRGKLPKTVITYDNRSRGCDDATGEEDYFNDGDFLVGRHLSVYGREMLICDCDDLTHDWYLRNKGLDQRASKVEIKPEVVLVPERAIPPPTGFGTEEDTITNLYTLIPKPPRKDLSGKTNITYRFKARLVTEDPIDKIRDFRVMYYQFEKEVSVYEPVVRNSGIVGGSFLRRIRLINPRTNEYFMAHDFVEGEEIVINSYRFIIYGTELLGSLEETKD